MVVERKLVEAAMGHVKVSKALRDCVGSVRQNFGDWEEVNPTHMKSITTFDRSIFWPRRLGRFTLSLAEHIALDSVIQRVGVHHAQPCFPLAGAKELLRRF